MGILTVLTKARHRKLLTSALQDKVSSLDREKAALENLTLTSGFEAKWTAHMNGRLQSFDVVAERIGLPELDKFFNQVLEAIEKAVFKHSGLLLDFNGDQFNALFGFYGKNNPVDQACKAATYLQETLIDLNSNLACHGMPPVLLNIGVDCQNTTFGVLKSNHQPRLIILGDGQQLTKRLVSLGAQMGCRTIVTQRVVAEITGSKQTRELVRIMERGTTGPLTVFELLEGCNTKEVPESLKNLLNQYDQALNSFYDKRFDEAFEVFKTLCSESGDGAACFMAEKARGFQIGPPHDSWEGTI